MIRNFIKIAIRNLLKHKGFALINITGLALGMLSFVLILLFVQDEWQYDNMHKNEDALFRIVTLETEENVERQTANTYHPLAPILDNSLPASATVARFFPYSVSVKQLESNEVRQEESFVFVDSTFFDVFSFELISGESSEVLSAPNNVVLTASMAQQYFGEQNPVGQALLLEGEHDFVVSGVVTDPPKNSTLQFDFLSSMRGAERILGQNFFHPQGAWFYPPMHTFAYLPQSNMVDNWAAEQAIWKEKNLPDYLQDRYEFNLQPIRDMHFESMENDLAPSMNPSFLWLMLSIGVLILCMACINYINLNLAQLLKRFPEIGMRKILGAQNANILQQMSVEIALFVGLSFLAGLALVKFSLPYFNQFVDKDIRLFSAAQSTFWLLLGSVMIAMTVILALFPYFGLIRYRIMGVLKRKHELQSGRRQKLSLRNALIIFQFTAACCLIIATFIIQYQLNFLQHKDIGFQPEQVLVVPIRDDRIQGNYEASKNVLSQQTGVKGVSAISNFPWESGFYSFRTTISGDGQDRKTNTPSLLVDEDFLSTLNIDIIKGRDFSKDFGTDVQSGFIFNQAAVDNFNIEDPSVMKVSMADVKAGAPKEGQIIGIAENFHLKSLHNPIEPLVLTIAPETYYLDNFLIKLETKNIQGTIAGLKESWEANISEAPFEYFFLDKTFESLYAKESQLSQIFISFTMLALVIAMLGLFALSSLIVGQRIKEIGIRKILGASVANIIGLLTKDFLILVIIALIISVPLSWTFMQKWLANFAYRIDISWSIFLVAGFMVISLAFLTVGGQSMRAAMLNPVKSLRNE